MVSIRRRKLWGICPGARSYLHEILEQSGATSFSEGSSMLDDSSAPSNVHLKPPFDGCQQKTVHVSRAKAGSFAMTASISPPKEQTRSSEREGRRPRRYGKPFAIYKQCTMRGVYYKNHKWQAAIKVNKQQIHLGTFKTQEEAAHLYDRAAFICGREPNFELMADEKQELMQLGWDEFLSKTRGAITKTTKKKRKAEGMQLVGGPECCSG